MIVASLGLCCEAKRLLIALIKLTPPNSAKIIGYDDITKELMIALSKNRTEKPKTVFEGIVKNKKNISKVLVFITEKYWNKEKGVVKILPDIKLETLNCKIYEL